MSSSIVSIPHEVLVKITEHRPHLAGIVRNLTATTSRPLAQGLEKRLADAYLAGETHLSPLETWRLSFCTVGERYGGEQNA